METNPYPHLIYDLSNPHFRNMEITTNKNELLQGQFVRFKVMNDTFERIYPAEKYCFLPADHADQFWSTHVQNNGEFRELPAYIRQFGLNEINRITVLPSMFA